MNALLFAAGLGTRLRPFTNDRPKALVEVAGCPLLEWNLMRLHSFGFDRVVINVHHYADMIEEFVRRHRNFGLDIVISDERDLLMDTGGGILKAAPLLGSEVPFLVHNVDIVSDVDLKSLYDNHCLHPERLATLLVTARQSSRSLLFTTDNELAGWRNNSTGEVRPTTDTFDPQRCRAKAFAGIHVISPCVFSEMRSCYKEGEPFSIIDFYLKAAQHQPIYGLEKSAARVVDVGKPESLPLAAKLLGSLV